MWKDSDKTLAVYYGAAYDDAAILPSRITVLLDENGNVILEYLEPNVNSHPGNVLKDCQVLFGTSDDS